MKKFLKPLFSRKILGAIILALQVAVIVFTVDKIYTRRIIYGGNTLIAILFIIYEINRDVSPSFKLIWIAIVAIMPPFGILMYLYIHLDILNFNLKSRVYSVTSAAGDFINKNQCSSVSTEDVAGISIPEYLHKYAKSPTYPAQNINYFPLGDYMFDSMLRDLENAETYIFMEYFILNEKSIMWKRIEDILMRKAAAGVDVRVIYDAMGSLTTVNGDFAKKLNDKKIKCIPFAPVRPFISSYHNNRDHRKILAIDGKYAYTGGINLSDEYINKRSRFGHWKDSAVRVEGEAASGFALMFLKSWALISGSTPEFEKYCLPIHSDDACSGIIIPFDDNPLDNERVSENVYLHMINTAKKYVYITTPYLILDDDLSDAMRFAAKRGVDIRIIMPHIPDKWYAFALARTYYPELINDGVKIYEYTPGFIHAKSTVCDGEKAFIGSANYDFRSLYLHYECGCCICNNPVISDMLLDFRETLDKCHMFTTEDYNGLNVLYRLAGRVFRFFAPLM